MIFLGVNIDHVATVRNARGGNQPDPVEAALVAERFGADGITAHLREDRRHIRDEDMWRLKHVIRTRLNMEMAATTEMVNIALVIQPYMVTLVPERREELTTEGGLDVVRLRNQLSPVVNRLMDAGIRVSLFIEPDPAQIEAAHALGAPVVELHTGQYAEAFAHDPALAQEALSRLQNGAARCNRLGLELNAGHGLTYENVGSIVRLPGLVELNIGHNIIAQSIFTGIGPAVAEMKRLLNPAPAAAPRS